MEKNLTAMNPYGKSSNWFSRRKEHCDNTQVKGRTVPNLLRLDSTGNTCCEKGFNSSIPRSMASCFAKTFSGMTSRNSSRSQDSVVGCASDYPILQNSSSECDRNMAAKNTTALYARPNTSCNGSFQGLAECLRKNACSSISQHPVLHHGQFQMPYFQFHPAVFSTYSQPSDSARKQFSKCQSQRTGKKSNRYFRYGWSAPQKKQSSESEKSGTPQKPENITFNKKQRCDSKERDNCKEVDSETRGSEHCNRKNEINQEPCSESRDILSSPLSNLSLGESVAIKNALNQCVASKSVGNDIELKPDWFSNGRRDSESKLPPSNTVIVLDNWDDEISEEVQSENIKLQTDMFDLLATGDETKPKEEKAFQSETSKCNSIQNEDKNCDTSSSCADPIALCVLKSEDNLADTSAAVTSMCQNSEPPAVLYQRNLNKKGRPSHKKRSRRKGSKHSKPFDLEHSQKRKYEDENSSKTGACTIAFIMGGSDALSPLNSDSDFSFDSDEDSSESVDDDIDFVCHFSDPLLMNVICSVKCSPVSPAVSAANRLWQIKSEESSDPSATATPSDRKVHFAEPDNLTETHIADEWNRKGQWEEFARDRERFKRRIEETKCIIDPILNEDHRQHVYFNLIQQN